MKVSKLKKTQVARSTKRKIVTCKALLEKLCACGPAIRILGKYSAKQAYNNTTMASWLAWLIWHKLDVELSTQLPKLSLKLQIQGQKYMYRLRQTRRNKKFCNEVRKVIPFWMVEEAIEEYMSYRE